MIQELKSETISFTAILNIINQRVRKKNEIVEAKRRVINIPSKIAEVYRPLFEKNLKKDIEVEIEFIETGVKKKVKAKLLRNNNSYRLYLKGLYSIAKDTVVNVILKLE